MEAPTVSTNHVKFGGHRSRRSGYALICHITSHDNAVKRVGILHLSHDPGKFGGIKSCERGNNFFEFVTRILRWSRYQMVM